MQLKVHVRLRPQSGDRRNEVVSTEPPHIVYLTDPGTGHKTEFLFNTVFGSNASQQEVFEEVGRPLTEQVLQGFNACCFAYGQSGSGKSYSMLGSSSDGEQRGIMPRCAEQLMQQVAKRNCSAGGSAFKWSVFASYLAICDERVQDLGYQAPGSGCQDLQTSAGVGPDRSDLQVYEDASGMTLVKDLTLVEASSTDDVLALLKAGSVLQSTIATSRGAASTKSHVILTLSVVQQRDGQQPITGRLHLVDLAGSECKGDVTNSSATTVLSQVVMAVASQRDSGAAGTAAAAKQQIPFRISKLTQLLKESLQGHISLLATLDPHPDNYKECMATLQYALRCNGTMAAPTVNSLEHSSQQDPALEDLMHQVTQLKQDLQHTHTHYKKLIQSAASARAAEAAALERAELAESSTASLQGSDTVLAASGKGTASNVAALEAKLRRLEMQLASSSSRLTSTEARLTTKKAEAEEFRESMMSKDFSQVNEMKRLRDQANQAQAALLDAQALVKLREDEAQRRFDEECARLSNDNEALRSQLAAMSNSVNSMMETRSSKALAAKQQRDSLVHEADKRLREQVATTVAEKDRQLDNLRQQSAYHLQRKGDEITALRQDIVQLRAHSQAEATSLTGGIDYVLSYAVKLTDVLRRLEAGVYGVVERGGLRQFKVPQRDKPPALQEDRLRHLRGAVSGVDALLATSTSSASSAAAANTAVLGTPSLPPASHIQSAVAVPLANAAGIGPQSSSAPGSGQDLRPAPGAQGRDQGATSSGAVSSDSVDYDALKTQWEASYREAVVSEVASELWSDKTVDYIRTLEAQLARYRQDLQAQKKQTNEMTVALRSVQKAHSRPGSAINAALSGQINNRPPTWGPGHASSSVHAAMTGLYSRPSTASATLQASPGMGLGTATLARSGSWGQASGGLHGITAGSNGFIREKGMSY